VLALFEKHYADYGPTLASEKLQERHRIEIHPETLRLWLRQARLPYKQRRARPQRQWRPRRPCFGQMVQMDGSHHDWLEGRGPQLVLMGYIDDATNTVEARFYDHEGTVPALDSFRRWVKRYGLPCSVYLDKHTTYRSTQPASVAEQLHGREPSQSQFQRAMSELGVEVIHAHSPAANAYASHCTSFEHSGMTVVTSRRRERLVPCAFRGRSGPGGSYRHSGLSVNAWALSSP
jgi:hypothetical protein